MSDFNITVNNRVVPVIRGQTVLQASLAAGIDIPFFCWHPQLVPVGACRICLVEIGKLPKLQVACATIATEGMVVSTESPKVVKARQGVLEFILAHHPLDCPTCDKGGECDLQDITFKYGLDYSRLKEPKHRFIIDEDSTFDDLKIGPEVIRNQNRCIHCFRCTRIVEEIAFEDDLGAYQRGYHTEILPPPGREIRNLYSGNVVEYCPVGALTNDDWRYKVRVWLTKQAKVICPHCPDGCNLTLWTFHGRIFRATSRANPHIDLGFLCDIGRYGYQFVANPDRVKRPMIRKQGELVESSWEEALSLIKTQTVDLLSKLSGNGFFGFIGGSSSNEQIYAFQRFLRRVIGTNNLDNRFHRRRRLTPSDEVTSRGIGVGQAEYKDIEDADVIVIYGADLHSEDPITALRVKRALRRHGAKVILVNSRPTPLGRRVATLEVIHRPGTGLVVLLGVVDTMVTNTGLDAASRGLSGDEVDALKQLHVKYAAEQTATIARVEVGKIRKMAELLLGAERVVVLTGGNVDRYPLRDSSHLAIFNLMRLCKSANLIVLPQESNSVGAAILGAKPTVLPGKIPFEERSRFENMWHGPIPENVGKDTIGILEAIDEDEIECGFVFNADPVRAFPDGNYIKGVMEKLKLLVVIDTFMTETARVADVILPLATFAETEGTRINWEGRMQYSERAIEPLFESKPGCEIIELLAEKLGVKFGQAKPDAVYREMVGLLPGAVPTSYAGFTQEGVLLRFPMHDRVTAPAEVVHVAPVDDSEYRFALLIGNADHHRGILTERNESLLKFTDEPFVGISETDARNLAVSDDDLVRVESKYGRIVGKAKVLPGFPDGQVLLPENFAELKPNLLINRHEKFDRVKLTKM